MRLFISLEKRQLLYYLGWNRKSLSTQSSIAIEQTTPKLSDLKNKTKNSPFYFTYNSGVQPCSCSDLDQPVGGLELSFTFPGWQPGRCQGAQLQQLVPAPHTLAPSRGLAQASSHGDLRVRGSKSRQTAQRIGAFGLPLTSYLLMPYWPKEIR